MERDITLRCLESFLNLPATAVDALTKRLGDRMSMSSTVCPYCVSPLATLIPGGSGSPPHAPRTCEHCGSEWWTRIPAPGHIPASETGLYWSIRGKVVCLEHAGQIDVVRWTDERWVPLPGSSQGFHRRRYQ